ncbi:MAG: phosphoglycerate dehydrogenase [Desulfamplus sp.]|nr:phosphoglycerate dehydrogenase [Desulfamplus sp.]
MNEILITTSSFGTYDSTPVDRLKSAGFEVVMNPHGRKLTEDEISYLIQTHRPVGIIAGVEPITADILKTASNLKVISRCGIGMDSVDTKAAADVDIIVTNTPDAPTIPVAELTVGMMLSLLRRIHRSDSAIRSGQWHRPMGNLVFGKTVGIIGCGRIGSYLASLLYSFKCTILGYDAYKHSDWDIFSSSSSSNLYSCSGSNFSDCFASNFSGYSGSNHSGCSDSDICGSDRSYCYKPSDLASLVSESDIITLHIPYSIENHHFINSDKIKMMKKGACIINAARGGLIDEEALYDALKSGHLGGAALDSFEQEPYSGHLRELDNVLLTGHIGSYATEGRIIMENQSVDNLLKALRKHIAE